MQNGTSACLGAARYRHLFATLRLPFRMPVDAPVMTDVGEHYRALSDLVRVGIVGTETLHQRREPAVFTGLGNNGHTRRHLALSSRAGKEPRVALRARLSQLYADAVHDGIAVRNPCSRRTSPGAGEQRPFVATTDQVWALYDAMPEHIAVAVLLGAFVGLRTAEVCGLRVNDVDFMRGIVSPVVQWPAEPLKTDSSRTPVPIPSELALALSASVGRPSAVRPCSLTAMVGRPPLGHWSVRSARLAARSRGCPATSAFTTCVTTWRRYSSRQGLM
jgi:integrase